MTTFEHFMLYICFGMTLGGFLGDLSIIICNITRSIKKKNKLRQEQKQLASKKQSDKE